MPDRAAVIAALDALTDPKSGQGLMAAGLVQGLVVADDRAGFALEVPAGDTALYAPVRDEMDARFAEDGEAAFRLALAQVDAPAEAAIAPGDRQRLVRAMAVARVAGRPLSALRADTRPVLPPGGYDAVVVEPDRQALYAACDARVSVMMENGAMEEVRALMTRDLPHGLPIMKAVGVRELSAYLRGDMSLDDALDIMRQATRNYAKRQMTWFRNQTPDWSRSKPTLV